MTATSLHCKAYKAIKRLKKVKHTIRNADTNRRQMRQYDRR